MTYQFDAEYGLIVVKAKVSGPCGKTVIRLALDTGATTTAINWDPLILIGYDLSSTSDRQEIATASGTGYCPRISILQLEALGQVRTDLHVLCHTLPLSTAVDGLLGLNFFRGCRLAIDFGSGEISVE